MTHAPRPRSKTRAWAELVDATESLPEGTVLACRTTPDLYQDLPDNLLYRSQQLDMMCGGCPIKSECREYGFADKGATGVWGGVQHRNDRLGPTD